MVPSPTPTPHLPKVLSWISPLNLTNLNLATSIRLPSLSIVPDPSILAPQLLFISSFHSPNPDHTRFLPVNRATGPPSGAVPRQACLPLESCSLQSPVGMWAPGVPAWPTLPLCHLPPLLIATALEQESTASDQLASFFS